MRPVRIGCSGWQYKSWRETFYPEGLGQPRWLAHYAGVFDTVEVNSTFYRLASREAVARWVEQTPPGFVFTLKASRYLTHIKRLTDMWQGVARFYERVEPLLATPKIGPVLWQLPPNFQRDDERLVEALAALPDGRHCFEFRHPTWFADEVLDILRRNGVALVIGDRQEVATFQRHELTADWTLIRFHYGHRGRRGNYSESEIAEWAERIAGWRRKAEVFAYFNNDWEEFAPRNALSLRRRLESG